VRARGIRLCEPCSHLQELTGQPVIKALRHRGGLRVQILSPGVIRAGDVISRWGTISNPNAVLFRELLRGKGAHVDPVASLEDIPASVAGRTLEGYPHSVWQLVSHMNYWMDYELRRIGGQRPVHPQHAIESWPPSVAPVNEAEWEQAREGLAERLSRFAALAESAPEALNSQVEAMHAGEASRSSSMQAVLWQILVHNSYHVGQITLLLRSFGFWPPKKGGDTW
jgi:uncharacterized damage-inducible protein DinB